MTGLVLGGQSKGHDYKILEGRGGVETLPGGVVICPRCGVENAPGTPLCRRCGFRFEAETELYGGEETEEVESAEGGERGPDG